MVKLMLALDVTDEERAMEISREVSHYVDAIKIGYPLVLSSHLSIVERIKKITKKEVICDFKLADIPSTNEKIASLTLKYGDGIICHGFLGEDSVRAVQGVARRYSEGGSYKKVVMVTEMSHRGALQFLQPVGDKLARMAKRLKVDAVVAPATRPERLKTIKDIVGDIAVMSPGIGAQGGDLNKVLDILTEDDYIIVGRDIYESENPANRAEYYYNILRLR
ncbi:MAG TPA: orotidine-5'-phosphate decarboxylase [Methanothermococcus okinawensis]|uniref:Orotidine 5'-phosphate decarboxylase n=1 Tax=Methanothermococcus okinawensis TaxID=155863 RepID=A0A832ZBP6_9EURY|nr:orotidine-5'-phosphate decarboxylase [Methanothermococcus okinawensis]HIP90934.1 orotidine-5'-phosphate decarboxylase [Methanothermococcus okinawensis]